MLHSAVTGSVLFMHFSKSHPEQLFTEHLVALWNRELVNGCIVKLTIFMFILKKK
jgi:hypothetical protein